MSCTHPKECLVMSSDERRTFQGDVSETGGEITYYCKLCKQVLTDEVVVDWDAFDFNSEIRKKYEDNYDRTQEYL